MITSEWGTPDMVESGVNPELLLGGKYGETSTLGNISFAAELCWR